MKKTLYTALVALLAITACGQNKKDMKTLVAYFSATGTTEAVAKDLAKVAGATLYEIKPEVKYTEADLDWRDKQSRSTIEMQDKNSRPVIVKDLEDADSYDLIYIGFPVWWYTAPTIINTFIETYGFKGKTVLFFATSGGSDVSGADRQFQAQYPDINPTLALPQIIMSLDPFSSGITLAALWAADVSTACTILLGAGTLIAQDIYKRFFNPDITPDKYMKASRFIIFAVGLVTLWMAFNAVGIVKMMLTGLSLTTAFTLVFLATMFAPGLCRRNTAFYTTLVGLLGLLAWQMFPSVRILPHPIYFEWIICTITLLVVRVIDKEPMTPPAMKKDAD